MELFYEKHLLPLFHDFKGMDDESDMDPIKQELWKSFKEVNSSFSKVVSSVHLSNDLIWVHHLSLILVPQFIKRSDVNANIGFSLQTPFPQLEIMETFPFATELVKSLLCCDVVGFNIYPDARHFHRVCFNFLHLDVSTKPGGLLCVEYNGRSIILKVNHPAITQSDMAPNLNSLEFDTFKQLLNKHT